MVFYNDSSREIQCEGRIPDAILDALVEVNDLYGGKLLYEGAEWDEDNEQEVDEAKPREKVWLVLAIIFFPITLLYLLLRLIVWVPIMFWKATR
jgi:hypothetical protein